MTMERDRKREYLVGVVQEAIKALKQPVCGLVTLLAMQSAVLSLPPQPVSIELMAQNPFLKEIVASFQPVPASYEESQPFKPVLPTSDDDAIPSTGVITQDWIEAQNFLYNIRPVDFVMMARIAHYEAGQEQPLHAREAVAFTILKRLEAGCWGGSTIKDIGFAESQYQVVSAHSDSFSDLRYIDDNSDVVLAAPGMNEEYVRKAAISAGFALKGTIDDPSNGASSFQNLAASEVVLSGERTAEIGDHIFLYKTCP
jgi:hypothetical protein